MKINRSGFTLVELAIVITVIAILAGIVVSSYSGAQARTRDTQRLTDAENIIKAIQLYQSDNSTYPATSATPLGTCTDLPSGYSYSFAQDGSWLAPLVSTKTIDKAPTPPNSSCTSYYRYISVTNPTAYNCPARTTPYYVLIVISEGTLTPTASKSFTPCTGASASWVASKSVWVFASDNLQS